MLGLILSNFGLDFSKFGVSMMCRWNDEDMSNLPKSSPSDVETLVVVDFGGSPHYWKVSGHSSQGTGACAPRRASERAPPLPASQGLQLASEGQSQIVRAIGSCAVFPVASEGPDLGKLRDGRPHGSEVRRGVARQQVGVSA